MLKYTKQIVNAQITLVTNRLLLPLLNTVQFWLTELPVNSTAVTNFENNFKCAGFSLGLHFFCNFF